MVTKPNVNAINVGGHGTPADPETVRVLAGELVAVIDAAYNARLSDKTIRAAFELLKEVAKPAYGVGTAHIENVSVAGPLT